MGLRESLSHLVAVLIGLGNRKGGGEGSQDNLWSLGGEASHRNDSQGHSGQEWQRQQDTDL